MNSFDGTTVNCGAWFRAIGLTSCPTVLPAVVLAKGLLLTPPLVIMYPQPVVLSIECKRSCGIMTEVL